MPTLKANIQRIQKLAGLSMVESKILAFALLINTDTTLENVGDFLGEISAGKMFQVLAIVLGLPVQDVKQAFSYQGRLQRSGLIRIDRTEENTLKHHLEILSERFAEHMLTEEGDPISMMRDVIRIANPPVLCMKDFSHLEEYLNILRPYLRNSTETGRKGVNILFYGPPGTGKSELTRVLADDIGCELYDISCADEKDDPIPGLHRMLSYRAAQNFLCPKQALIVFDEVEDIFGDGNLYIERSVTHSRKAWMNQMLEENAIPAFWVSNTIGGLNTAFVRRFDMVIKFTAPPKKQREKLLAKIGKGILTPESLKRIASMEAITPGVASRACSVVRAIDEVLPRDRLSASVELLLDSTLEAQGHVSLPKANNGLPEYYDISYVNSNTNLKNLAQGLIQEKEVRICLYGPSGTGKTAFGRWLADTLELPLHLQKASDILGPYIGQSERQIANAFRNAEREGAILLIDEVDSFLRDRRGAERSWEVTMVNEMLTQMEGFSGVFIASTNLMEEIDQAALRRFDLKICFNYLQPEHAWQLFIRLCKSIGIQEVGSSLRKKFQEVRALTPGDFATVRRQQRFKPSLSPRDIIDALQAECSLKESNCSKHVGFL